MGLREAKTGKGHEQTESVEGQTEVNMLESRSINKNKSSLYVKSAERDCNISGEENTGDNITGKNDCKA